MSLDKQPVIRRTSSALTLPELPALFAIIAILMTPLLPALEEARLAADAAVCVSNLRQFGIGVPEYARENGDWFPPGTSGDAPGVCGSQRPQCLEITAMPGPQRLSPVHTERRIQGGRPTGFQLAESLHPIVEATRNFFRGGFCHSPPPVCSRRLYAGIPADDSRHSAIREPAQGRRIFSLFSDAHASLVIIYAEKFLAKRYAMTRGRVMSQPQFTEGILS